MRIEIDMKTGFILVVIVVFGGLFFAVSVVSIADALRYGSFSCG